MAVDKKSDHYTTSKTYEDYAGNTKSFDIIDYDPKTKIGTVGSYEGATVIWEETKRRLVEEVLSLPASASTSFNGKHEMLVKRDIEKGKIEWIEEAVRILAEADYWQLVQIKRLTQSNSGLD